MKISFYINQMSVGGGAERVTARLANYLCNQGNELTLVTINIQEKEYKLDSRIKRVSLDKKIQDNKKQPSALRRIKELRKYCINEQPDVLIAFAEGASEFAVIATLGMKQKLVISLRNAPSHDFPTFSSRLLAKLLLPQADGCVFQTEEVKKWFPSSLQNKSTVIMNPVDDNVYTYKRNPIQNRIIACGRLTDAKNHELLIKAFIIVHDRIPDSELYIYGEGNRREYLQSIIESKELCEYVHLMGYTSNIHSEYCKGDIFVMPSLVEGLPNALMEAMTIGLPCISTDCDGGGARLLIGENEFGIIVSPNNEFEMAEQIVKLLTDEKMKSYYSMKAIKRADSFRLNRIAERWFDYVSQV